MYISRHPSDFVPDSWQGYANVSGTSGGVKGRVGNLRENVLGIERGVYLESLPVDRIIPWGNHLNKNYELSLFKEHGVLVDIRDGCSHKLVYEQQTGLPIMESSIFDGKAFTTKFSTDVFSDWSTPAGALHDFQSQTHPDEEDDGLCCFDTSGEAMGTALMSKALLLHKRLGHWSVPGLKVDCPGCNLNKGQAGTHAKVRPVHEEYAPLRTLAIDYAGPYPESIRGYGVVLVVICDSIKKCWLRPLKHKPEVAEEVEKIIPEIRRKWSLDLTEKLVCYLRRDSEPVLGTPAMQAMMTRQGIADVPGGSSQPTAQRHMRAIRPECCGCN